MLKPHALYSVNMHWLKYRKMILGTGREAMGKTPLLNYTWIVRGYFLQSGSKGLEQEQGQRGIKGT